jgi:hypothetical protein
MEPEGLHPSLSGRANSATRSFELLLVNARHVKQVLVYGYANGVMSSRKPERATYRDVAVRMLCADQHPDYRSIVRFRKRHLDALASCSCKRCGCAGRPSWSGWGRSPSMAPSCVRTRRVTRR